MLTLRLKNPAGSESSLSLAPGLHEAGSATLPDLPAKAFDLEASDFALIVAPASGVALDGRPLAPGIRRLLRPGQVLSAAGFELRLEPPPAPTARLDGTAALARGLIGGAFEAPIASQPSLTWLNGRDCGKRLSLLDEATFLGRGDGCGARIRDALASRTHAKLIIEGGIVRLVDLASANGLFVDEQQVEGERELRGGETIRVGETELLFEAASTPVSAPAPAAIPAVPPVAPSAEPAPRTQPKLGTIELAFVAAASSVGAAATAAAWLLGG